jgi:hypothetical protein
LQEQVTQQVVMSLVPEFISKQASNNSTELRVFDESYDKAWRAAALLASGVQNNQPDKIETALGLCLESIEANPKCEADIIMQVAVYLSKAYLIGEKIFKQQQIRR